MDFDYTEYEYLPECTGGCGALTAWLPSNKAADEVVHNHERQTGHSWSVQRRMKDWDAASSAPVGEKRG